MSYGGFTEDKQKEEAKNSHTHIGAYPPTRSNFDQTRAIVLYTIRSILKECVRTCQTAGRDWEFSIRGGGLKFIYSSIELFARLCYRIDYLLFHPVTAKKLIEAELGAPLHVLFKDFEEQPIAALSLG